MKWSLLGEVNQANIHNGSNGYKHLTEEAKISISLQFSQRNTKIQ